MAVLFANDDQAVEHAEILYRLHGYHVESREAARVLCSLVSRLRQKLAKVPGGERLIKTVCSMGYMIVVKNNPALAGQGYDDAFNTNTALRWRG